jgi:hypothetical protein
MRPWPRGWRWQEILGLVTIVVVLLIAIMTSD